MWKGEEKEKEEGGEGGGGGEGGSRRWKVGGMGNGEMEEGGKRIILLSESVFCSLQV